MLQSGFELSLTPSSQVDFITKTRSNLSGPKTIRAFPKRGRVAPGPSLSTGYLQRLCGDVSAQLPSAGPGRYPGTTQPQVSSQSGKTTKRACPYCRLGALAHEAWSEAAWINQGHTNNTNLLAPSHFTKKYTEEVRKPKRGYSP